MSAEHDTVYLLKDGVILLGASLAFVLLFRRLGLGAVLGYLVAGALIGPQGIGLVGDAESKMGIAELGIVLLLFLVGLELNLTRLWRMRRDIFGFGLAQVMVCGALLALVVHFIAGFSIGASIAVGLPLALSSTAQVLPMLRSAGRMNTPFGERAFSILLFQDLSIVPLITVIAALSRTPANPADPPGWMLAIYTVVAVPVLMLAGRYVMNPLFRLIGGLGERELFVAAGLFTVLAAAAAMQALHLSTALGAFVAGVMLADSPYRHELEADVEPFRTILLGLFFLAVGMKLDLNVVAARPFMVLGLAASLVIVKAIVIYGIARISGMPNRSAIALGLLLSQGGEFAFVLFAQAHDAALIAPEAVSLFGAVVTLSMATTPFLMAIARKFSGTTPVRKDLDGPEASQQAKVIVVGYGRFGQTAAQMLMARGLSVTLIDSKPEQIDVSNDFGMKVYYGDGTRVDLLRQAGAEEVSAILFCLDDKDFGSKQLTPILEAFPQAATFVRAFDRRHLIDLMDVDVAGCVREVYESAISMGRAALLTLGVEADEVQIIEQEYRRRDSDRLEAQFSAGDLHVAKFQMFAPGRAMTPKTE